MMPIIYNILDIAAALIIIKTTLQAAQRMTSQTRLSIRLSYTLIASGAVAIMMSRVLDFQSAASSLQLYGLAIYMLADKRQSFVRKPLINKEIDIDIDGNTSTRR